MNSIPASKVKVIPQKNIYSPILHSSEYLESVPLSNLVNTAGAEDPIYHYRWPRTVFFFTREVSVPASKQLLDGVTGIYVSMKINRDWIESENIAIIKSESDELLTYIAPDGNELWFTRTYMGAPAIFRSTRANDD